MLQKLGQAPAWWATWLQPAEQGFPYVNEWLSRFTGMLTSLRPLSASLLLPRTFFRLSPSLLRVWIKMRSLAKIRLRCRLTWLVCRLYLLSFNTVIKGAWLCDHREAEILLSVVSLGPSGQCQKESIDYSSVGASSCRIFYLAFAGNGTLKTKFFNVEINIALPVKDFPLLS